jgi:hypothetical protein
MDDTGRDGIAWDRKRRIAYEVYRSLYPDGPVPYDKLVRDCDLEIAKLKGKLAVYEADPRKGARFRKLVLAHYRKGQGTAEDDFLEAAEDDYFWPVEETETILRLALTTDMRRVFADLRDRPYDEDAQDE